MRTSRPLRPAVVLALATLAPAALGQNDFDLDKATPGTLGAALLLAVSHAPASSPLLVMPSLLPGPTALASFGLADPRSVQVGTDLSANWFLQFTSGAGTAAVALNLPNVAAFGGMLLHWQTLTFPGATSLVGAIGNDVVVQAGLVNQALLLPAQLLTPRTLATGFPDAATGDLVIAGGGTGSLLAATGLQTTEIWDVRHLRRRAGPSMTTARALHVAVVLPSGRVLLAGGAGATGTVLASCELYDPVTGTFTPTGSMATPRVMHAGALLHDGRVLVAGGTSSLTDTTAAITNALNSAEIWNPATGTWSAAPALGGRRLAPALTTLPSGRVLESGGVEVGFLFGLPVSAVSTPAVQLYDPATNAWSAGPAMPAGRAGHHYNQVALADGRILMSGGVGVPSLLGAASASPIANADLYNPATNSWTATLMGAPRTLHSARQLPDGRVVVAGGAQGTLTAPVSIASVEAFDPTTNVWSPLGPLGAPRSGHVGFVQGDGLLVLIGGQDAAATTATIESLHY